VAAWKGGHVPRDLYDVLGVPGTASEAEIRRAFHTLAKRYHPDVHPRSPEAARRFVEVGNAAETLLDPTRRARYDESRTPRLPARPPAAPPKPQPRPKPQPPRPTSTQTATAQNAKPPPPAAPDPVRKRPRDRRWIAVRLVAAFALIMALAWWMNGHAGPTPTNQGGGMPANGTVVWQTADFSLADGWGINLAGNGARIQLVPGTSSDIEFTGGYLSSAGQIALLPQADTPTYQHCVTAVEQAASQPEPLSGITPTTGGSLCASGSGGDLASILVIGDSGSSLTVDITVWEYV
jgi:hypothetical protein